MNRYSTSPIAGFPREKETTISFSKVFISIVVLCFLSHHCLYAQIGFETPSISSPTAAGLGKYGDIPISHHTGVPNIDIPIFNISEGNLSLPISMSYHSSGIRVDELASWVGLGWSLNAGGVISRTVVGTPDEGGALSSGTPNESYLRKGWYQNYGTHSGLSDPVCWIMPSLHYGNTNVQNCQEMYVDAANGFLDTQPDLFNFNFGGFSGKFFFDKARKAHIIPRQDIQIIPEYDEANQVFLSWQIIAPNGTKYFFGTDANAIEYGYSGLAGYTPGSTNQNTTSWFLTRIESMNGENWMEFSYEKESYSFTNRQGHTVQFDCLNPPGTLENLSLIPNLTSIDGCRISQITTSSGQTVVDFLPGPVRSDVTKFAQAWVNNTEAKSLEEIQITIGSHTRTFHLDIDYFSSNYDPADWGWTSGNHNDAKRLRLNALQEVTGTSSANPNFAHTFSYNSDNMGRRLSLGRDFWGYYNGADNNTGLFPNGLLHPCSGIVLGGMANRNPNETHMQAWILTDIQFPTGGTTSFEYEAHDDGTNIVGGLRIQSISTTPGAGSSDPPMVQTFVYSAGVLYGGYPDANSFSKTPHLGNSTVQVDADYILEAKPPSPSRNSQGYHIGYSMVSRILPGQGKTVYQYYNTSPTYQNPSGGFPEVPVQADPLGGKLFKEEQFDEGGTLLSSTQYEYVVDLDQSFPLRVVTTLVGAPLDGSGEPSAVPIYNEYIAEIGRAKLIKTTSFRDGVTTIEEYEYSDEHNSPVKTSMQNSDNSLHETESRFFDHWLATNCEGDASACFTTFHTTISDIRNQYVNYTGPTSPSISGADVQAYFNEYAQAQIDYWNCVHAEWQSVDICRENELNNFVPMDASFDALPEMIRRNLITPLEVVQKVNGQETLGTKLAYKNQNYGAASIPLHVVPSEYYRLTAGNWELDVEVSFDQYDNISTHIRPGGSATSYVYGHKHRRPAAQILNAPVGTVAYTSFENPGEAADGFWLISFLNGTTPGGWDSQTSKTCDNSFNLSQDRQMITYVASAGDYILSYWLKGGSIVVSPTGTQKIQTYSDADAWTYHEHELTIGNPQFVSLSGLGFGQRIDEVRLYPKHSHMTSYCYDKQLQVGAVTGPNGAPTEYKFDDLGRLVKVLNHKKELLNTTEYKYYNQ